MTSGMSTPPPVGAILRSTDPRQDGRMVRVIEHEMTWDGAAVRRLRVENTATERRTRLRYPLSSEWVWSPSRSTTEAA
jgi:hypothetical protein